MRLRKKPVEVDAIPFNGFNKNEIKSFTQGMCYTNLNDPKDPKFMIRTLEGEHIASPGDWIIKGVKGEFYPCKPDILVATYDPVEEDQ